MPAFLIPIIEWLAQWLLPLFVKEMTADFKAWWAARTAKKAIEDKNQQVRDQTEAAQTPEQRDEAAQNLIDHF